MGGTDFKWGGRAPLAPLLATALVTGESHLCDLNFVWETMSGFRLHSKSDKFIAASLVKLA